MNLRLWIFAAVTFGVATASNADLTPPVFSGSAPSIAAGQSVTFSTNFTDTLTAGYDSEYIKSVSYVFNSGDGQTFANSFTTNSQGGIAPTVNLSQSFTYATPGSYQPSFSATVTTFDNYHQTEEYQYQSGTGYHYYSCGFFSTCSSSYPIYSTGSRTNYYTTELSSGVSSATDLTVTTSVAAAVPEPETYATLLAGLGLIGAVTRRRRLVARQ